MVEIGGRRYNRTEIKTHFSSLLADEPTEVGGRYLGPTPYDLLMASFHLKLTAMTLRCDVKRKNGHSKRFRFTKP